MTIHKAFLLGAGLGTRLRPLTDQWPKPLVPFYHEPLIIRTLIRCKELGITDVMINTHHLAEAWSSYFSDQMWEGMQISFSYEPVLLETGGGLKKIEEWVGRDHVLVMNADILCNVDLRPLIEQHVQGGARASLLLREDGDNRNVGYDGSSGLITDMRHLLGVSAGGYQFSGIYCISPELLKDIPEGMVVSVVPAFVEAIKAKKLRGVLSSDGFWIDMGNMENYRLAHRLIAGQHIHEKATVASTAQIDSLSVIYEDAVIEDGVTLLDCIVMPGAKTQPYTAYAEQVLL